jgi:hypothetical protein
MKTNPIQNTVNPISAIFNLEHQRIMEQFFFFFFFIIIIFFISEEKINKNIIAENGSMECCITIHRFLSACETKNQYGSCVMKQMTNKRRRKKWTNRKQYMEWVSCGFVLRRWKTMDNPKQSAK